MPDTAMQTALKSLVKAVGWACTTYTFVQIVGGKLSGPPLLGLVVGGLVYGLSMFAFELYQRGKTGGAH